MSKVKIPTVKLPNNRALLTGDHLAYIASLIGITLLPLALIPWMPVPLGITKNFWLILMALVVGMLWLAGRLQKGNVVIPKSITLLAGLLVVFVTLVSSLFSGAIFHSLIGSGFDNYSFVSIFTLFIILFLLSTTFEKREKVLNVYLLLFAGSLLVGLYSLFKLLVDRLGGDLFVNLPINLIGSWYSLGVFFGFIALSALIMLELFPAQNNLWFKRLLYTVFGFGLFVLAFVNFYPTWIIFGVASMLLFVYMITVGDAGEQKDSAVEEGTNRSIKIFRPASIALLISLFFIILGGQTGLVKDLLDQTYARFNFSFVDVRPSFSGTLGIVKGSWSDNILLGSGPNNFTHDWLLHKPLGVNELPYWNFDFDLGFGVLPSFWTELGVLGFLAWLVFLGSLFLFGLKGIFDRRQDSFARLVIFLLFVGTLYLWVFAVIYPVAQVLWGLAFITSGLLIGQLASNGVINYWRFSLAHYPRINFISVLLLVVLIMGTLTSGYLVVQKYWAANVFYQAVAQSANLPLQSIEVEIARAIKLDDSNDLYFRTLTDVYRSKINLLLQGSNNISPEALQEQFVLIVSQARKHIDEAIKLNPNDYRNWVSRALIYEMMVPLKIEGGADEAKRSYLQALALNPKSPSLRVDLARLSFSAGDIVSARKYLEEALTQKTNYTTALFMLAQLDLQAGKTTEALSKAGKAVAMFPNDPSNYFQLGFLQYQTNNFTQAVNTLSKAVELSVGGVNANVQYFLGLSYDQLGEKTKAIEQFEIIRKYNPNNQEILTILSNLRAGRGALSGANNDENEKTELELPIDKEN